MRDFLKLCLMLAVVSCQPPVAEEASVNANTTVVQGMYDAFAVGDVDAVVAAMSDGIVWNEAEHFPYADGNPYIGPEAVVNGVFARIGEDWNDFRVTVEEMIESGDTVVAFGRYSGQNKATGKPIDAQFVHVWTVADGKAARFQQYADTAQVRDAMRADEPEASDE